VAQQQDAKVLGNIATGKKSAFLVRSLRLLSSISLAIVLASCFSSQLPTSTSPGLYSTTTGQQLPRDNQAAPYQGWPDNRVLLFNRKTCVDSFRLTPLTYAQVETATNVTKADHLPIGPGVVSVANDGLCFDEAEIPNRAWRHYVAAQRQAGIALATLEPTATALPIATYYTDPFYDYYPVVGISYEQAQAFCRWRSQVVSSLYNRGSSPVDTLAKDYIRVVYRLPTEQEWEHAALVDSQLPFGTSCTHLPVTVVAGAADYLRRRSGSSQPTSVIKADILAYNATHPIRHRINYAQEGPYFLHSATPSYVYQGPANDFGLYQMLGNVAELVQEKGITKGGSYRDALTNCRIKARGTYMGPTPAIGFRTAFTLSYPNRRPSQ
jgi:formylglycine-generating enzyme required for sulfatase activity